jgi:hypothetical protein
VVFFYNEFHIYKSIRPDILINKFLIINAILIVVGNFFLCEKTLHYIYGPQWVRLLALTPQKWCAGLYRSHFANWGYVNWSLLGSCVLVGPISFIEHSGSITYRRKNYEIKMQFFHYTTFLHKRLPQSRIRSYFTACRDWNISQLWLFSNRNSYLC